MAEKYELTRTLKDGAPPPLYEWDEYLFQRFCRDLFECEGQIATCEEYGTRGQRQYGVDVIAHRTDGASCEVGQCKCQKHFTREDIRSASDDFLDNWDHWKGRHVERFVLFVAADLTRTELQDEISRQRQRFQKLGIAYDVYSLVGIRNRLRREPSLVHQYFDEYWTGQILGESVSVAHRGKASLAIDAVLAAHVASLREHVATESEAQFDRVREEWRKGDRSCADEWIAQTKANLHLWNSLPAGTKSRVLLLEASLDLEAEKPLRGVRELMDAATEIDPQADCTRLKVLLARAEGDLDTALAMAAEGDDTDSINLAAALQLEAGDAGAAATCLAFEERHFRPNAETFRLRSLALLMKRSINEATVEIKKAVELEPEWVSVRMTAAMIDYFASISPTAVPDMVVPWPEPVPRELVLMDAVSLERLTRAAQEFFALADLASRPAQATECRVWALACLANLPDREEDAESCARKILRDQPTNCPALAWTVSRQMSVEVEPSLVALRTLFAEGCGAINDAISVVLCLLLKDELEEAADFLDEQREFLCASDARSVWVFWKAQVLHRAGKTEEALECLRIAQSDGIEVQGPYALLSIESDEEALDRLKSEHAQTGDGRLLLAACELASALGCWDYVQQHSGALIQEIGTPYAIELSALSLFNVGNATSALSTLDNNRKKFRGGKLTRRMRELRAACHAKLGALSSAVSELETLLTDHQSGDVVERLIQVQVASGDYAGLIRSGRILLGSDAANSVKLHVADLLASEDRALGTELWKEVVGGGIADELVGQALFIGHKLDLNEVTELAPLTERAGNLARQERGGFVSFSVDDALEYVRRQDEHATRLQDIYRRGTATVHAIAHRLGIPLVDFYRGRLRSAELGQWRIPPTYIRHGGKSYPVVHSLPAGRWTLNADVSSVLLAAQLNLLEVLEQAFRKIRIPQQLIPALVDMERRVSQGQPAQQDARQSVIESVSADRVQVVESGTGQALLLAESWQPRMASLLPLSLAARLDALVVGFLPLAKNDEPSVAQEPPDVGRLTDVGSLLECMAMAGLITSEELTGHIARLGSAAEQSEYAVVPSAGSRVLLDGGIAELLARAGTLDDVLRHFQVYLPASELNQIRERAFQYEERRRTASWLRDLIKRLRLKLENGAFEVLAEEASDRETSSEDGDLASQTLESLIRHLGDDGDVMWVDDRFVTAYPTSNGTPIVGTMEVLDKLRAEGRIEASVHFSFISKLRCAGFQFLPLTKGELEWALGGARVVDGVLQETDALRNLRAGFAASLREVSVLQRPPMPEGAPNPNGEVEFLTRSSRALADVFCGIWMEHENEEGEARSRSDYLLRNLYVDQVGMLHLAQVSPGRPSSYVGAVSVLGFLTPALPFGRDQAERSRRRAYFEWVFARFAKGERSGVSSSATLVNLLRDFLSSLIHEADEEAKPSVIIAVRHYCEDFPRQIHDELLNDPQFSAVVGLAVVPVVEIAGLAFDRDEFWTAAETALNGVQSKVTVVGTSEEIQLVPIEGSAIGLDLFDSEGERRARIAQPHLAVLCGSAAAREEYLKSQSWFAGSANPGGEIARISTLSNPRNRIEAADVWRNRSAAEYYERLLRELRQRPRISRDDMMPPSPSGLLAFLGLSPDLDAGGLEGAASDMLQANGLAGAIEVFAHWPVALPEPLVNAFRDLTSEQRKDLLRELLQRPGSVVTRGHLARLLLGEMDNPALRRMGHRLLRLILSDVGYGAARALVAAVRFAQLRLAQSVGTEGWSQAALFLASWGHGGRIYSILAAMAAPDAWIRDTFTRVGAFEPSEIFSMEDPADVADAREVSPEAVLAGCAAYAMGAEDSNTLDPAVGAALGEVTTVVAEDGLRWPRPALLRATSLMENRLQSFLGWDLGEELRPFNPVCEAFSSSSLEQHAHRAAALLQDNANEFSPWLLIRAIVRTRRPYVRVAESLRHAIANVDIVAALEGGWAQAWTVLEVAIAHADSQDCRRLGTLLPELAPAAYQNSSSPAGEHGEMFDPPMDLLELAYRLSRRLAVEPVGVVREFADLLSVIMREEPRLGHYWRDLLLTFALQLPQDQARYLWPVLVDSRSVQ